MEVEKTPGCADSTERISRHNFLSVYCVAYVYSCWKLLVCTELLYASSIWHLCPDEFHIEWGKCCVLTF